VKSEQIIVSAPSDQLLRQLFRLVGVGFIRFIQPKDLSLLRQRGLD
jgi:hypothetical protein